MIYGGAGFFSAPPFCFQLERKNIFAE